jgi:predicted O-methyltransferase YrrM
MSLYVAPISTRNQFGELLSSHGLTGKAVEVGTHLGYFARSLLNNWPGHLTCVDPYENAPAGYAEQVPLLEGSHGGDRVRDRGEALRRLRPFISQGRCTLLQKTSAGAVLDFPYDSLDFVYLDGDHRTEAVVSDLELWWPRVKPGGILAGHDIICPGETADGKWGAAIQPAVFNHFWGEASGCGLEIPIQLVVEEGGLPWSFYVVKR